MHASAFSKPLRPASLALAFFAALAPLPAQEPGARAALRVLDAKISAPLLFSAERQADLRFFAEPAKGRTFYWIANRGKEAAHFAPEWIMQGGEPHAVPEGSPSALPGSVHLAPGARMYLVPPPGFLRLELSEVRIGPDTGPFLEISAGGPQCP